MTEIIETTTGRVTPLGERRFSRHVLFWDYEGRQWMLCAEYWHAACATGAAWDVECVHEGRARSVSELRIVAASPCRCGAFGERAMRERMEWVWSEREVEVFG